jgi:branched-chain amino acid transport system permease protein
MIRRPFSLYAEIAAWLLMPGVVLAFFPTYCVLASQIAIAGLFALSLDLLIGYAGIVSLGHAAFFGVGAYAAGLLAQQGWSEPLSGLLLAAVVSGVVGYACSFMVVRVQHLAQLMITLGISLLLYEGASKLRVITGGDDGLQGVVVAPIFGLFNFDLFGRVAFLYSFVVLLLCFLFVSRVVASPFGLALQGLRENPRRMAAIGTAAPRRLRKAYVMAAILAGIAGALLTQTTQFVALEVLSFKHSAEVLIMLVLGGSGRRYGGLLGALLFSLARDWLSDLNAEFWQFGLGAVMVIVVLFAPGGLIGGVARILSAWRHRGEAAGKDDSRKEARA